ncbi:hypothetical protein HN014_22380 (plasmid) [Aquimarina sp. TRL1]|uniref:hypothetical protein n=1 Tax=Aquimarina sp. (strain TRL1) TaxID=2736252 RepID=UPI00158D4D9B|nr:hypothetical protein [Aquimarina sp. TRL1]QKX07749.1 hypothetical protein HN014_22380 [Aquimarina sp. TRL1]
MEITKKLIINKKYIIPSGLGGIFQIRYLGKTDNGKYKFENVQPHWDGYGSIYTFSENQVNESVKDTHSNRTNILYN